MSSRIASALIALAACGRTDVVRFEAPPPEVVVIDSGSDAGVDSGTADAGRPDAGLCAPGFVELDGACVEVAAALDGLRWQLPCVTLDPGYPELICFTSPDQRQVATMRGPTGRLSDVQVRVRGVVETRAYQQGTVVAPFVRRGGRSVATPDDADAWNIYRLDVSDPPERWFLNDGASGEYVCHAVDATFTVRVRSGASVTLFASSVDARRSQIRNRQADGGVLVIDGLAPAPRAFDGQFLQLDVLGVTPVP